MGEESYQYRALMRRSLLLQIRRRGTTICQILVPIILLFVTLVFNWITVSLIPTITPTQVIPPTFAIQPTLGVSYYEHYWMTSSNVNNPVDAGTLFVNGTHSGFVGGFRQRNYLRPNGTLDLVPYFTSKSAELPALVELQNTFRQLSNGPTYQTRNNTFAQFYALPNAMVTWHSLNDTQGRVNYTIRTNNNADYTRSPSYLALFSAGQLNITVPRAILINSISTRLAQLWANVRISISLAGLPFVTVIPSFAILDILSVLLYPFAMSTLIPVLMYTLVLERELRILPFLLAVGLRMKTYLVSHYLFAFGLYFVVALLFVVFGLIMQLRFFLETHMLIIVILLLQWGLVIVPLSMFMSALFSTTRTSNLVMYLIVILSVIFSVLLNFQVYSNTNLPTALYIYPPFAFYRGLYLISNACTKGVCMRLIDLTVRGSPMATVMIALLLHILVWTPLGFYMVIAREQGGLWPCRMMCGKRPLTDEELSHLPIAIPESQIFAHPGVKSDSEEVDDPDVSAERAVVMSGALDNSVALVAKNAEKIYPGGKRALAGVSMSIRKGECFGLLGPNGAGKTTLISVLTGLRELTSGQVLIGGRDVARELDTVRRLVGICPQHDILWDELTCEEHLLFYCRLKGVPAAEEQATVKRMLMDVGLDKVPDRLSKQLSGGMKRRLSVAMSTAGNPELVFLDEPTTGTDPATRRQLWQVIETVCKGRAVLLTTHRMDEADVLCSRISIMARGRLLVIGPQQTLKSRYGGSYLLHVNYQPEDAPRVDKFVRATMADCVMSSQAPGTTSYEVPTGLSIGNLFAEMETRSTEFGVQAWSIAQRSLEDVFLNVIQKSGAAR